MKLIFQIIIWAYTCCPTFNIFQKYFKFSENWVWSSVTQHPGLRNQKFCETKFRREVFISLHHSASWSSIRSSDYKSSQNHDIAKILKRLINQNRHYVDKSHNVTCQSVKCYIFDTAQFYPIALIKLKSFVRALTQSISSITSGPQIRL